MKKQLCIHTLSDDRKITEDVELSNYCPCCNVALSPQVVYGAMVESDNEEQNKVFLLNYCPNCQECFISTHFYDENTDNGYIFVSAAPMGHFIHQFSESISNLSPNFVTIYNESLYAETQGLMSICGMGYRKALEFLIKDFIIHKDPTLKDSVSKKMLMPCINEYISDERLKSLAKASTWLGNDETHYIKKHTDLGIENLKTFINAFVTFIDAELAYEEAYKFINK